VAILGQAQNGRRLVGLVEWEQRVAQFLSATLQGAGVFDRTGRCDAWHFTAGGAGATIQSFTAVPRSISTASSGSPLR
jgi:hypothetical protein